MGGKNRGLVELVVGYFSKLEVVIGFVVTLGEVMEGWVEWVKGEPTTGREPSCGA